MSDITHSPELVLYNILEFRTPSILQRIIRRRRSKPMLFVDGTRYKYHTGHWAYWIPDLQCKFLYSADGFVNCIGSKAPPRAGFSSDSPDFNREVKLKVYSWDEWQAVYSKKAIRRTAEIYLVSQRLYDAGLGPKPLGICGARQFSYQGNIDNNGAWGIRIEDASKLPHRPPVTEQDVLAAGVQPDRTLSCLRDQLNGYVIDLNTVVGVMPINAEEQIVEVVNAIKTTFESAYSNS